MKHSYRHVLFASLLAAPVVVFSEPAIEARLSELEQTVQQLQQRISTLETKPGQSSPEASVVLRPGNSNEIRNWRQLRKGMSEQDVERLLGSAGKVDVSEYTIWWYYNYPGGGSVMFDAQSRKVKVWQKP